MLAGSAPCHSRVPFKRDVQRVPPSGAKTSVRSSGLQASSTSCEETPLLALYVVLATRFFAINDGFFGVQRTHRPSPVAAFSHALALVLVLVLVFALALVLCLRTSDFVF